jgi:Tol biopolymer transport system component
VEPKQEVIDRTKGIARNESRITARQSHRLTSGGKAVNNQAPLFGCGSAALRTQCLCGEEDAANTHHRDAENIEVARRGSFAPMLAKKKRSPDGRIFFTSKREGRREIYAMNADGGSVGRFTTTGAITPVWSRDGTKIAFVSENLDIGKTQHPLQVFVANADGSNVRNLTKESPSTFFPCWSGDSASVAYAVDNLGVVSNIYQVDLNGGNIKRLTAGPKMDTQPAISPDGSKLAFQTNRDGNYEIYVMQLR